MAHVPHLLLPGPWTRPSIILGAEHSHHLDRVLRMREGEPVSYTDGLGLVGEGVLGDGVVVRGDERAIAPPPLRLTLAVAPPDSRERVRFLTEKLAELGVARLRWLRTRRGQGRPPRHDRAAGWAQGALEQSRGAWLMQVDPKTVGLAELDPPVVVAHPGGQAPPSPSEGSLTVAVGPEGGFEEEEIDRFRLLDLGTRILRVETAALVVAARLLEP